MLNIELVKIETIKNNPNNPRVIKDDKFKKLVKSIKEFPEMLNIRPIVIDEQNYVLGGNMRLKACNDAGIKDIPVIKVTDLTEEQKKQFIIKDNSNYGQWDWEVLQTEWDLSNLEDWGLDLADFPTTDINDDDNDNDDNDDEVDTSNFIQKWFLNIELTNEKECQQWYEKLKKEGLNCKIVQ